MIKTFFSANVRWAFVGALLLPFARSLSYCWTINTDVNWDKGGLNIKKEINALCFRDDFYESYINHIIEFDKACQYFIRISNKVSRNNCSNHIKSCPELIRLSDWYCMTSSFFLASRCLSICCACSLPARKYCCCCCWLRSAWWVCLCVVGIIRIATKYSVVVSTYNSYSHFGGSAKLKYALQESRRKPFYV